MNPEHPYLVNYYWVMEKREDTENAGESTQALDLIKDALHEGVDESIEVQYLWLDTALKIARDEKEMLVADNIEVLMRDPIYSDFTAKSPIISGGEVLDSEPISQEMIF